MADTKTYTPGRFVWREIISTNIEATQKFFQDLVGWTVEKTEVPDLGEYRTLKAKGLSAAGLMRPPERGVPSTILGYISVDDVDAAARRAVQHGAKEMTPPTDVMGVGRLAVMIDPQGAGIAVFKDALGDRGTDVPPGVGEFCWEQYEASDVEGAKRFYGELFGWKVFPSQENPKGFMFGTGPEEKNLIASLLPAAPGTPSRWLSSLLVESLEHARAIVKKHDGKVLMKDIQVPGFGAYDVVSDPAGVTFCTFMASMPKR